MLSALVKYKIVPVAIVAALLGGGVGAIVSSRMAESSTQATATAPAPATPAAQPTVPNDLATQPAPNTQVADNTMPNGACMCQPGATQTTESRYVASAPRRVYYSSASGHSRSH